MVGGVGIYRVLGGWHLRGGLHGGAFMGCEEGGGHLWSLGGSYMEWGGYMWGVGGVYGVAGRGCGASVALNLKNENGGGMGLVCGGPHRSDPSQIILLPPPSPKMRFSPQSKKGGESIYRVHVGEVSVGLKNGFEGGGGGEIGGLTSPPPPPIQEYVAKKRLRARLRALEPLRQACPPHPQNSPLDPTWLREVFGAGGVGGALPKGSRFTRAQHLTHEEVGGGSGSCWGGGVCYLGWEGWFSFLGGGADIFFPPPVP